MSGSYDEVEVIFRTWKPDCPPEHHPRKIKAEVPGWAGPLKGGHPEAYDKAQPWHCKPFLDTVTGGIEIPWSITTNIRIWSEDGVNCDVTREHITETKNPQTASQFALGHFGVNSHISIIMPDGWGGMIMPHPAFYMSPYDSWRPFIIPGLLEFDWWPRQFFVVGACPGAGKYVEFKYGEPFCMVWPVRSRVKVNLRPMDTQERYWNQSVDHMIHHNFNKLSNRYWRTKDGKPFANLYKMMSNRYRQEGVIDWQQVAKEIEWGPEIPIAPPRIDSRIGIPYNPGHKPGDPVVDSGNRRAEYGLMSERMQAQYEQQSALERREAEAVLSQRHVSLLGVPEHDGRPSDFIHDQRFRGAGEPANGETRPRSPGREAGGKQDGKQSGAKQPGGADYHDETIIIPVKKS